MDHWRDRAACRDWVDVFDATFDASSRSSSYAYRTAANVCAACLVARPCLSDALTTESRGASFGMRGGLMPAERRAQLRRSA